MTLKLTASDVGKKFRTRDGEEATIVEKSASGLFRAHHPGCSFFHDPDGTVPGLSDKGNTQYDLISRIDEEESGLCLEVGKTYEDSNNDIVRIVADVSADLPDEEFHFWGLRLSDGGFFRYRADGRTSRTMFANLIKEHTPPPTVEPVWVVVNTVGGALVSRFKERASLQAANWNKEGLGPCDVRRIDLKYEGGRRDDLEEGNG